ncbi:MAG: hypothetical protein P8L18_00730 [Verrucomicrobiota bacterium]|nr:hypothetical protein [Verrucomicrobiota bacterium]
MPSIQEFIHKFEEGDGTRSITKTLVLLLLATLFVSYNFREYRSFSAVEAMEMSQLARNLSEGKGYTTQSIRPFSLALVASRHDESTSDPSMIQDVHPDLSYPPLYPSLLSLWMRVLPFDYDIPSLKSTRFRKYQPEILISFLNQGLFILSGVLVFILSRHLFDKSVAWMSTAVFFGSDVLWRFSLSGLSTMLSLMLFMLLVTCLVLMERASRAEIEPEQQEETDSGEKGRPRSLLWFLGMAVLAGLALGFGGLTRYAFLCLLIPSICFSACFIKVQRVPVTLVMLLVTMVLVGPWLVRNYDLSGNPFGMSYYSLVMDTPDFPGDRLERTLTSEVTYPEYSAYIRKLLVNTTEIMTQQLPMLGGSWMTMFFFVGLMIPFSNPGLRHLRIFLLISLALLLVFQALGRTFLSEMSPVINNQNHLVMLAPLLFMFGVALFFTLLDQLPLPFDGAKKLVILVVLLVVSSPLFFRMLPPRTSPMVYPPYSPPLIQEIGSWIKPTDLMMSDMPWAIAWYGDRSCLWPTRSVSPDFYAIHDEQKPIRAVYLSSLTTDKKLMSEVLKGSDEVWARFYMDIQVRENLPKGFPLKYGHSGVMPDMLYVSDQQRWLPAFKETNQEIE